MIILGEEIKTFQELEKVTIDELTYDDTYVDEDTGELDAINTIEELYEFLIDFVDEEDQEEFDKLIEDNAESFNGLDIDCSDPYEDARRFYNSTRGC